MSIENIVQDGFKISNTRGTNSLALNSLAIGTKAYFSTYQSVSNYFDETEEEKHYGSSYFEKYSETILHFQHFFELMLKDILRNEHEILALKFDSKADILITLINGQNVNSEEIEKIQTVEFGVALERTVALIKNKADTPYTFLTMEENKKALKKLTELRNKIWHRGSYIMRYKALDIFIGKYILPLAIEILEAMEYTKKTSKRQLWKYGENFLDIDPLKEIITEIKMKTPRYDKVAVLKELGRASYNSHLGKGFGKIIDDKNEKAHLLAKTELDRIFSRAENILQCPCCGANSLVTYLAEEVVNWEEIEYEENDQLMKMIATDRYEYTEKVRCPNCDFHLYHKGLKDLKEYGFEGMPDYWE
ncbi:hypothetical protein M1D47_09960 [Bacillus sp. R1-10]